MTTPNSSVLIVGAGTFGLSTAYRLAKAGYKKVTVLEKSAVVPSELSAGNDLNKILRAEYEDPFYADLALQAMKEWQTPLFAPYYHQTGYLLATSSAAPEKSKKSLAKSLSSISSHPAFKGKIIPLNTRDDIRSVAPVFDGPMQWTGYFNRFAGYAHASDAMRALYSACCALEVTFHLNDGAKALLYDNGKCVGVTTNSGKTHRADAVVLTLGASLGALLPQAGRQIAARAFPVGHIQLSRQEARRLAGIPVTYARDIGFFFEPDPLTGLLKLCASGGGYTNYVGDGLSVAPEESDWIPARDEERMRLLLRETLPGLADRPIILRRLCWCADSSDTNYVIDFVPGEPGLLVVSGDSGHGYKMMPVLGDWVREVLEKGRQDIEKWRWKEGRHASAEVSWRVGKSVDIKEVGGRSKL